MATIAFADELKEVTYFHCNGFQIEDVSRLAMSSEEPMGKALWKVAEVVERELMSKSQQSWVLIQYGWVKVPKKDEI